MLNVFVFSSLWLTFSFWPCGREFWVPVSLLSHHTQVNAHEIYLLSEL